MGRGPGLGTSLCLLHSAAATLLLTAATAAATITAATVMAAAMDTVPNPLSEGSGKTTLPEEVDPCSANRPAAAMRDDHDVAASKVGVEAWGVGSRCQLHSLNSLLFSLPRALF